MYGNQWASLPLHVGRTCGCAALRQAPASALTASPRQAGRRAGGRQAGGQAGSAHQWWAAAQTAARCRCARRWSRRRCGLKVESWGRGGGSTLAMWPLRLWDGSAVRGGPTRSPLAAGGVLPGPALHPAAAPSACGGTPRLPQYASPGKHQHSSPAVQVQQAAVELAAGGRLHLGLELAHRGVPGVRGQRGAAVGVLPIVSKGD